MKKIVSLLLVAVMLLSTLACFAACGDEESADSNKVKVINIPLTVEEYAFAVSKGNTELLGQLNAFMATIKADGRFDEIVNKYFGDGTPTPVVSAATQKNDGSQLVVATNAAFEPFEYKVGENYYGVDMEIMALFAQHLGKELYISNMEFNAVCLAVSATGGTYEDENGNEVPVAGGMCDVAAAGLTVNEKRAEILDFTESYYNASQVLIVPESDTTFDACQTAADVEAILKSYDESVKIGVQSGTTGYLYCKGDADWGFDGYAFTTVGYNTGALAVQDIINGNIKFVVIDEGPAKAISAKMNSVN
ncbi:MAG: transporter substrate-binding domain-containing protein [Clostridia bacterium]|nr:transporter substrate-binding domain-containing protein [Clostridia bacterium]